MLQDLEHRRSEQKDGGAAPHSGLRPTFYPEKSRHSALLFAGLCTVALASGIGAYYGYTKLHTPAKQQTAATSPPVVAANTVAPTAQSASTEHKKAVADTNANEIQTLSSLAKKSAPKKEMASANQAKQIANTPVATNDNTPVVKKTKKAVKKSVRTARKKTIVAKKDTHTGAEKIERKARPLTPQQEAEHAYRDALTLARSNRDQAALAKLKTCLAFDPTHAAGRELMAKTQLRLGNWRAAQTTLEQGLERSPNNRNFLYLLARIYSSHNQHDAALALLEKSNSGSHDANLIALKAALYQHAKRHSEAAASYRQAISLRPSEGRLWLGMGISLEAQQDWRGAKSAYEQALQYIGPNDTLQNYLRQRLAYAQQKNASAN